MGDLLKQLEERAVDQEEGVFDRPRETAEALRAAGARIAALEAEVERLRGEASDRDSADRSGLRTYAALLNQRDQLAEAVQYAHDNTAETPLREAMRAALAELTPTPNPEN